MLAPFVDACCSLSFRTKTSDRADFFRTAFDQDQFLGLITEATSPTEFFAPENIGKLLGNATDRRGDA